MASIPEHEYEYNRRYSIYGNLTKMIEFYHGGRGFLTNEDTVRKLLWLIKERTGINYVPESSITSLFPTEAAVTAIYNNGYQDGVEEGKRQYDWLRKQAEAKYKDLKVKYDKLEQETKAIEKHSDTAYDKGYLKGIEECTTKNATVLGDLMQKMENKGYRKGCQEAEERVQSHARYQYDEGYLKGIEEGTKGKEKFATDRAEEAYSKGYRIGLGNGIRQGKKEVVDFINNMKVSQ